MREEENGAQIRRRERERDCLYLELLNSGSVPLSFSPSLFSIILSFPSSSLNTIYLPFPLYHSFLFNSHCFIFSHLHQFNPNVFTHSPSGYLVYFLVGFFCSFETQFFLFSLFFFLLLSFRFLWKRNAVRENYFLPIDQLPKLSIEQVPQMSHDKKIFYFGFRRKILTLTLWIEIFDS